MPGEQQSTSGVQPQSATTGPDLSRPVATSDDYASIKEARAIFIDRKRPITEHTLQRYCEKEYLSGQKRITAEGEKWFVLKSSVLTRIAEMEEFDKLRQAATSADMSEPVAEILINDFAGDKQRHNVSENVSEPVVSFQQSQTTSDEGPRPVATSRDNDNERETHERIERRISLDQEREHLERQINLLKEQSVLKDKIISRYEVENTGLRDGKEKLYSLLEAANQEKILLIEGDRDSKAVMKNNNSLIAYLSQLFKGKDEIAAPMSDATYHATNLTDTLRGDERGM